MRVDQAVLELARARLDKSVITAPFDGVVGLRKVSIGDFVDVGQDMVNLEQIDPLKADFRVAEIYLGAVRPGQPIELVVDAFPGETFAGEVYAIDPLIDESGRSIVLRARLPNAESRLRPGLFARVTLVLNERDDALQIPEQALVPQGQDQFVFRVIDGKAALTKVEVGHPARRHGGDRLGPRPRGRGGDRGSAQDPRRRAGPAAAGRGGLSRVPAGSVDPAPGAGHGHVAGRGAARHHRLRAADRARVPQHRRAGGHRRDHLQGRVGRHRRDPGHPDPRGVARRHRGHRLHELDQPAGEEPDHRQVPADPRSRCRRQRRARPRGAGARPPARRDRRADRRPRSRPTRSRSSTWRSRPIATRRWRSPTSPTASSRTGCRTCPAWRTCASSASGAIPCASGWTGRGLPPTA